MNYEIRKKQSKIQNLKSKIGMVVFACLMLTPVLAQKAELVVQTGHSKGVAAVAFSPDGKLLASGGLDHTIKLWDAASGQELRTFKGHAKNVFAVAFSPDGKVLASASLDRTVKLWDAVSGQELKTFNGHTSTVYSIVFSPDGKTLASASQDKTIRLWDTSGGGELRTLNGHRSQVNSIAFSADGKILASAGRDGMIKLWDASNGRELKSLSGDTSDALLVAFSPDGTTLASTGSADKAIKLWDASDGRELRAFSGHDFRVSAIAFSPDGKMIVSASRNKMLKFWDAATGKELKPLTGHDSPVSAIAFSPDGRVLATADTQDSAVKLWDVGTRRELRTLSGHSAEVASVIFSSDGKVLASINRDKTIKLWDIAGGRGLKNLTGHRAFIPTAAFSPGGETLASVSWDRTIKLWSVASGKMLESYGLDHLPANFNNTANERKILDEFSGFYERNYHQPLKTYPAPLSEKFVAQRAENGRINLLDRITGAEVITLIALDTDDWVVITPEGLFDASPNGRKLLHYIIGLEPITLEQMKSAYYVPGLLQKIYKAEPLPKAALFSRKDLFPEVGFQTPTADQKELIVNLTDRGGGIGRVQILVNGKEVSGEAISSNPIDSNAGRLALRVDLTKTSALIPGEENRIEVVARNRAGSLSSRGARGAGVLLLDEGQKNKSPPDIYAIIAGISDYTGDDLDLQFAAKDAEDFAKAIELGAISFLGDENKVHIRLLTARGGGRRTADLKFNAPDALVSTATKADFEKAFSDFKRAKPGDVFIVYLAGHGLSLNLKQNANQFGGDTYLYLTQEAITTDASVLSVENTRRAMTLSGDEIKELMKHNGALKQVLILDTCAAGAYSTSIVVKRDLPSDQIRALENLKDSTGFYVLMGAAADSVSYEASQYGQGLLTYSLLQAMKGARLREDQFANVALLFNYAQETVPELAKKISGVQRPLVIAPDASASFDIGRFTAVEQKQIRLAAPRPLVLRPSLQNESLRFDNLKMTGLLTTALREASFSNSRGANLLSLVFVDTDEMADAVTPSGTYRIEGDELIFEIVLVKNNRQLGDSITLRGKSAAIETLIAQLVEKITISVAAAEAAGR